MFVNKHDTYLSGVHISKSKRRYNLIPSVHYFYVKTKMLAEFQICISVPLRAFGKKMDLKVLTKLEFTCSKLTI